MTLFARVPWMMLAVLLVPVARAAADSDEAVIRGVLDEQVAAWNRKDLEGYMAGYWRSPDLTFYSGGAVTRGWQATLERYRKRYQGEGREMGTLQFADLSVEKLGPATATARGGWRLRKANGEELKGLFTVILRRLPEGWRIVHDHSSVASP
jgi:beta-aspartyl-peptidase (threonine type)